MTKKKRELRRLRQEELLKNFQQDEDHYEEKKVGSEWYIKNWNGGTKKWQVSVYSNQSYRNYKNYNESRNEIFEIPPSF